MPTTVPSKQPKVRAPRIKKLAVITDAPPVAKKPRTKRIAAQPLQEPRHISSGAGMTAGLELWTSATGQVELRDITADNRFAADITAWSSLNAAALKKGKDAATQ
jgi:hypothetical protein